MMLSFGQPAVLATEQCPRYLDQIKTLIPLLKPKISRSGSNPNKHIDSSFKIKNILKYSVFDLMSVQCSESRSMGSRLNFI